MDKLIFALAVVLVAIFATALVRSIIRWRGGRRAVAVLVAITFVAWLAKLVVDLRSDPTSHNLWPLEAMGVMFIALVILGACALTGPRKRVTVARS